MNQFRQPINNRYNPRMSRYDMQNAGIAPVSCPLPGNPGNSGSSGNFGSSGNLGSSGNTQAVSGASGSCAGDMRNFPLAMAYVPRQSFTNLNDAHTALTSGTLFSDLYLDFHGRRCN